MGSDSITEQWGQTRLLYLIWYEKVALYPTYTHLTSDTSTRKVLKWQDNRVSYYLANRNMLYSAAITGISSSLAIWIISFIWKNWVMLADDFSVRFMHMFWWQITCIYWLPRKQRKESVKWCSHLGGIMFSYKELIEQMIGRQARPKPRGGDHTNMSNSGEADINRVWPHC